MAPVSRLLAVTLVAAATCVPAQAAPGDPDLARFVDPMVGTFAPGFTVPGAATPFGMVQVSPDTGGPFACSGYLWTDPTIYGFSHVHLSGPGVTKAGDIPFMPTTGPVVAGAVSAFDHATERAEPGYYRVRLGASLTNKYVQGAGRSWITHRDLRKIGTLTLRMGATPDTTPYAPPPSLTDSGLEAFACDR